MDDGSWLSWILFAALVLAAAFFALCETAASSVSRVRLKARQELGERRAEKALYIQDPFDAAISTILVGTNIVHISAATLVTVMVARTWGTRWVALGTVLCTVIIFFAGETLPKTIARRAPERHALGTAAALAGLMKGLGPLARLLSKTGAFFASRIGGEAEVTVTEDELYDIIDIMTDEGELDEDSGELIQSALTFGDITAERVFTPRVDVDALDAESGPEEVLAFVRDKKHSRIPVYRGSIDNVVGILRASAYMRAYLRDKETPDLPALLDAPCFVHQSASVDEVLEEMTRRKVSIAVVTDNYGGTAGIVTVEDILEELVGEIWDEDDVAVDDFRTLDDGSCLADADLDMEEVLERLGYEDPEDTDWEHKPLGEWVYEHFDMIPAKGDSFDWQGLRVQVEEIDHRRIRTLRITRLPGEETGGEQE